MSFSNTSVVPRITLTPALGTWSALFAGYHAYLSLSAGFARSETGKFMGTAGVPEGSRQLVANRAFGNFSENVPLALLLAGVCELNGADAKVINAALGTLFVLRIAHAELGLKQPGHVEKLQRDGYQYGRLSGFLGSNAIILGLGTYALSLCFPAIKAIYGY